MAIASGRPVDDTGEAPDVFDENGALLMTKRIIKRLCREQGSYITPEMNTTLYLNNMRFKNMHGLADFKACKVLHLEYNCLEKIQDLDDMSQLQALFLQGNDIGELEGLDKCMNLDALNISNNPIHTLKGLPPSITTLHAANIGLVDPHNIAALAEACPCLHVLDLSQNQLQGQAALEALCSIKSLRVLYIKGNPVAKEPQCRRTLISQLPDLTYLDDAPVEEVERVGCQAWAAGGKEAEVAARLAWREGKRRALRRTMVTFAAERARRRVLREVTGLTGIQVEELVTQLEDAHDVAQRLAGAPAATVPARIIDALRTGVYRRQQPTAANVLPVPEAPAPPAEAAVVTAAGPAPEASMPASQVTWLGCQEGQTVAAVAGGAPQRLQIVLPEGGAAEQLPAGQPADDAADQQAAPADAQQSECVVCSEDLLDGELVLWLPCSPVQHCFHERCIRRWLEGFSNSCPLCRAPVLNVTSPTNAAIASMLSNSAAALHTGNSGNAPATTTASLVQSMRSRLESVAGITPSSVARAGRVSVTGSEGANGIGGAAMGAPYSSSRCSCSGSGSNGRGRVSAPGALGIVPEPDIALSTIPSSAIQISDTQQVPSNGRGSSSQHAPGLKEMCDVAPQPQEGCDVAPQLLEEPLPAEKDATYWQLQAMYRKTFGTRSLEAQSQLGQWHAIKQQRRSTSGSGGSSSSSSPRSSTPDAANNMACQQHDSAGKPGSCNSSSSSSSRAHAGSGTRNVAGDNGNLCCDGQLAEQKNTQNPNMGPTVLGTGSHAHAATGVGSASIDTGLHQQHGHYQPDQHDQQQQQQQQQQPIHGPHTSAPSNSFSTTRQAEEVQKQRNLKITQGNDTHTGPYHYQAVSSHTEFLACEGGVTCNTVQDIIQTVSRAHQKCAGTNQAATAATAIAAATAGVSPATTGGSSQSRVGQCRLPATQERPTPVHQTCTPPSEAALIKLQQPSPPPSAAESSSSSAAAAAAAGEEAQLADSHDDVWDLDANIVQAAQLPYL